MHQTYLCSFQFISCECCSFCAGAGHARKGYLITIEVCTYPQAFISGWPHCATASITCEVEHFYLIWFIFRCYGSQDISEIINTSQHILVHCGVVHSEYCSFTGADATLSICTIQPVKVLNFSYRMILVNRNSHKIEQIPEAEIRFLYCTVISTPACFIPPAPQFLATPVKPHNLTPQIEFCLSRRKGIVAEQKQAGSRPVCACLC